MKKTRGSLYVIRARDKKLIPSMLETQCTEQRRPQSDYNKESCVQGYKYRANIPLNNRVLITIYAVENFQLTKPSSSTKHPN
jgi:hypothetical protein